MKNINSLHLFTPHLPTAIDSKKSIPLQSQNVLKSRAALLLPAEQPGTSSTQLHAKSILPISNQNPVNNQDEGVEIEEIEQALGRVEQLVDENQRVGGSARESKKASSIIEVSNPLIPIDKLYRSLSVSVKHSTDFAADILRDANLEKIYLNSNDEEKDKIHEGLNFFQSLIPPGIEKHQKSLGCDKQFEDLKKLGHFFLNALVSEKSENSNLIISYKLNLLKASEKLYTHLDENLGKIFFEQKLNGKITLSDSEKKQIKSVLNRWKIELKMQKSGLDPALVNLGVTFISSGISGLQLLMMQPFFNIISSQVAIQITSAVLEGLGATLKVFRTLVLGIELILRNKQMKRLKSWVGDYQLWKKESESTSPSRNRDAFIQSTPAQLKNKFNLWLEESSLEEITHKLKKMGVDLDDVKTYGELQEKIEQPNFRADIERIYIEYHQECEEFNKQIQSVNNLYEKRVAIHNKKVFQTRVRFKEIQQTAFSNSMQRILKETQKDSPDPSLIDQELSQWRDISNLSLEEKNIWLGQLRDKDNQKELFESWFVKLSDRDKTTLLSDHIHKQEVLNAVLKGSISQLISKKQETELFLGRFKRNSTRTYFYTGLLVIGLTAALTTISFLSLPISGVGAMLFLVSAGSLFVTLGLFSAGLYVGYTYIPAATKDFFKALSLRMFCTKVCHDIQAYRHQYKMNKMVTLANSLATMNLTPSHASSLDKKALEVYKSKSAELHKRRLEIAESEKCLEEWEERLKKLEKRHLSNGWQDFSKQADLPTIDDSKDGLNGLSRFAEALKECDFSFLSKDVKYLLEQQMGINIRELENDLKKNPKEFEENFKKHLQNFVTMTDFQFSRFARKQQSLVKKGLIKRRTDFS